ncbi:MAG TPA: DUF4214 domain-containing protein [Pirellulales bacterium]|nr:DUF4214 domain-containing protein [Pirellulales bacterium]
MAARFQLGRRLTCPERLEARRPFSGDAASAICLPIGLALSPQAAFAPSGYTPQQVRQAYGLGQVSEGAVPLNGAGQTIAVVDAFDDPTIAGDLRQFDRAFGLADPPSFQKVELVPGGVGVTADAGWASEASLDVEWAHAVAPGANILLVESADDSQQNLFSAAQWAAQQPGVSVVSMSFGSGETRDETSFDGEFTTPSGHEGVTFLAATGDRGGTSYPSTATFGLYPALSPNVVGVGATELTTDAAGNYVSEVATGYSGGGYSRFEPQPAYQQFAAPAATSRETPDVAFVGGDDGGLGIPIYDSYTFGVSTPWSGELGTSASTVGFAAVIAIADEGRALLGEGTLDGPTQTLPFFYASQGSFHDITQGGNAAFQAGPGYDLVTGLGTPIANRLVPQLAGDVSALDAQGGNTLAATLAGGIQNRQLATFTDPNGPSPLSVYVATVDWGDGSVSAGVVAPDAVAGLLSVFGSHFYAAVGSFNVHVSIARSGQAPAAIDDTIEVTIAAANGPTGSGTLGATGNYVASVFQDVYARAPTAAELSDWEGQFSGGLSRPAFAAAVVGSYEYFSNDVVTPAYEKFLGRVPDPAGLAYWTNQLRSGLLTDESLAAALVGSAEYFSRAGGTNPLWVDALYRDLLGRTADSAGESFWVSQLQAGASRTGVALGFANAAERLRQEIGDAYRRYLGRAPDPSGLDFWMSQLAGSATDEELIIGLIASDEFYGNSAIVL